MKKILFLLLCLFILPVSAWEYEFLSPSAVVIKNSVQVIVRHSGKPLKSQGFWQKENALRRDCRGKILRKADISCFTYLFFEKPFKNQEETTLQMLDGSRRKIRYDRNLPTQLIKHNQLGYLPEAQKKYAYIGLWCGTAGAFDVKPFAGKMFELRQSADDKTVFTNTIALRREDPLYQGKIPFTGEITAELDFSRFAAPGRYYLFIPGLGRSRDFEIGSSTLNEAFFLHARGLYHKRCGTAKTRPYTFWESPACHQTVLRGRFPENNAHYTPGKNRPYGFFDRHDNAVKIRHFDLIKENLPYTAERVHAPGGWHDAADYDRRPFHLQIVCDLATVFLLKPQNFIDGQLHLPESGNGIPDILDEAAWGLKHLLAAQQKNGGVGTWFETTGHPGPGEGFPDKDNRTYYISAPSRNGTLFYAAAAAVLALTLPEKHAAVWKDSAIRAWEFAMNKKNRLIAAFRYKRKVLFYREEAELSPDALLRAGIALFQLTGERKYISILVQEKQTLLDFYKRENWRLSPPGWILLNKYPHKELASLLAEYRKVTLIQADKMLKDQENAYPYRTLWRAPEDGWVHAMAWGNYHPLRRALTLISAHALTGEKKYLTGAYLANDFHNGANPMGKTMTSGLGTVYPAAFLDLPSYATGFQEFVPGITPYGNTFGMDRKAVEMVYKEKKDQLPIWRRLINLETLSVPSSEYSVWETIAPAAAVTGYLISTPALPTRRMTERKPVDDFRKLPGYRSLP